MTWDPAAKVAVPVIEWVPFIPSVLPPFRVRLEWVNELPATDEMLPLIVELLPVTATADRICRLPLMTTPDEKLTEPVPLMSRSCRPRRLLALVLIVLLAEPVITTL